MHYFVRSRSAQAVVCAAAFLFLFYAMSTPLRRVAAHGERGAAERGRPAQRGQSDMPADLRAAVERTRAAEGREVPPAAATNDAGAQNSLMADPFLRRQELRSSEGYGGNRFGFSVCVSGDTAIVGAPEYNYGGGSKSGAAYVFVKSDGVWTEQQKLEATGSASGNNFGHAVSLSGDTAIVGANAAGNNGKGDTGLAYVFVRNGTTWTQQQRLRASDAAPADRFGSSVSVLGDTLVVGADGDDNSGGKGAGSAYVFVRSGTTWTEQQRLQASGAAAYDGFGTSVAMGDRALVVGAPGNDNRSGSNSGAAYVYTNSGGVWREQQLRASATSENSFFGCSVAISGDTAIVGAYQTQVGHNLRRSGSAYVYTRRNGVWTEQQRLQTFDLSLSFGSSVSVSGDTAIVSAPDQYTSGGILGGLVYVFTRKNGVWTEQLRLYPGFILSPFYGNSISVSGDTFMVGAVENGSAYAYTMNAEVWGEQQQLRPPATDNGSRFGRSVAISGNTAVVVGDGYDRNGLPAGTAYFFTRCAGVWSEQQRLQVSAAGGLSFGMVALNGNTAIFGASDDSAGAAYVFTRSGGVWSQQQRLKASDAAAGDGFGSSVAISGDTAVVGAFMDDNSGGSNAGSAYVFTRSGGVWSEQQRLQGSGVSAGNAFGHAVSISGETAIVGAYRELTHYDLNSGTVYAFTRSGGVWSEQARLTSPSPPTTGFHFGYSVSISGETAVAGAPLDQTLSRRGFLTGAAHFLGRNGGVWSGGQLRVTEPEYGDDIGNSVAISDGNIIVGAHKDDNGAGIDAGSAYIFTGSATNVPGEHRRLQASDAAAADAFGTSVAISGTTAIVGAPNHYNGARRTGAAYIFDGLPPVPSPVLISEFRLSGPGIGGAGAGADEFVELYNNTDADITVGTADGSAGWTLRSSDGTLNFTIPNGDTIPARGHYLVVNSAGYSLAGYPTSQHGCPGGNCASGNRTYTSDTPENTGLALFRTASAANFTLANRLDAAAPLTEADALYREGDGYTPVSGDTGAVQHSFVRNQLSGTPRDCGDRDFILVATDGAATLPGAVLGAPAPENTGSPIQRNASISAALIDLMQPSVAAPNRIRNSAPDASEPANSTRGTFKIRRKFTNSTGAGVTRLRFRVVDLSTTPRRNNATADLRVLPASGGVSVMLSSGESVPLTTLTREEPPAQSASGGGFNTTLSATLAEAIPHKASIYVEFNLGVVEDGNFSFWVNVEALTGAQADPPASAKPDAQKKTPQSRKGESLPPRTP